MYNADSHEAQEICDRMGWRHEIRPLETMNRSGKVYLRGTALKPEEYRTLRVSHPKTMLDGRPIVIAD